MKKLANIFKPYNFSENPCHIITFQVLAFGFTKIEVKLPNYVQQLTGIFASINYPAIQPKIAGYFTLNFNGNALQAFQMPIVKTTFLKEVSTPYELNEALKPNSFMQGYYYDATGVPNNYPYTVTLYLHYKHPK
jgi:hypothetical protein